MQPSETVPAAAPASGAVPPTLTEDGFLGGRLRLLQPEKGFRAGIDSVFLAAAVPCQPGDAVFEAGIGPGVAAHCLLARVPGASVTGIELITRYAMLCEENAKRNGLSDRLSVIRADVREALRRDQLGMPAPGGFAHAMVNPPFFDEGKSTPSPHLLKSQAHAFGPDDLELWAKLLHAMLAPRGSVTIVHRTESLGELLGSMQNRFGDIRIAPLFPRRGVPAVRILVQGIKGSKAPLQILPGLVLHDDGNGFTPEADAVLREAGAFPLR